MNTWMGIASTLAAVLAILFCVVCTTPLDFSAGKSILKRSEQIPILNSSNPTRPWSVIEHQGGNSPWIRKIHGTADTNISPPEGCHVDQIHMISRHAERYPTVNVGLAMLALYHRIKDANVTLHGDLDFVNRWDFFTQDPAGHFEGLVSTGPYAGTLEAFETGVKLRTRYKDLLETALANGSTSFWASDSRRVIDSAKYFAAGFFGIDWDKLSKLYVVPETPDRGADTLTPGRTCANYRNSLDPHSHDYGYEMMNTWRSHYENDIVERLTKQNPHFRFFEAEIFTMQQICGFETIAKGSSPWCDVFTREEVESFEYSRDVLHYYRAGPGNPYSGSMGWLWLNATANLLVEGPEAGPLFFSFVHDGDIVPLLTALDLLPQTPDLPVSHILPNRTWRTSDVVPMGGRLIFERLSCPAPQHCWSNAPFYPNHVYCEPQAWDTFIRLNVNDGIVALPGCDDGPGSSCPLADFVERVQKRGNDFEDFRKICGLGDDAADRITFLHQ